MLNFSARLKKLRKEKGLNQDELAAALGVRKTTISNYETGYSKPTNSMMRQISEYFGVPISELLEESHVFRESAANVPNMKEIPIYTSLPVAGLIGTIPAYFCSLPSALLGDGEFFALKLSDERMNRSRLSAGSLAIIRHQNFADDGDIVLVRLKDSIPTMGRYYRSGNGCILSPDSDNNVYRPLIFEKIDESFVIMGKVVHVLEPIV